MAGMTSRPTWDEYFMNLATLAATRSTCLKQAVGAVVVRDNYVLVTGYNGVPSGLNHCSEQGYCYSHLPICGSGLGYPSKAVHAEANAIAQAAKLGVALAGASIYCTHEPCLDCLKLIISAGIERVYYKQEAAPDSNEQIVKHLLKANLSEWVHSN